MQTPYCDACPGAQANITPPFTVCHVMGQMNSIAIYYYVSHMQSTMINQATKVWPATDCLCMHKISPSFEEYSN